MKNTSRFASLSLASFLAFFLALFFIAPNANAQVDLADGLIAHYPFTGHANDVSGKERHGTPAGGVALTADRAGNGLSAYNFDGVDDAITLGIAFAQIQLPLSFSVWVNRPSSAPDQAVAIFTSNDGGAVYTGFFLRMSEEGTLGLHFGDGGKPGIDNRRGIESSLVLPEDTWVHVVGVIRSADDMSMYFDASDVKGVLEGTGESVMVNDAFPASIGMLDLGVNVHPWVGGLDDIRIYDRALSFEEVEALYHLPAEPYVADPSVLVTEIMQNPDDVTDSAGEWFELFNITSEAIDLNGWTIKDMGTDVHVVDQGLIIQPQNTLVLCKNVERDLNGDVPCDYQYTDMLLGNKVDQIILVDAEGVERDRVEYDDNEGYPSPVGASMFYTAGPEEENNVGANWTESFARAANYGNTDCPECDDLGSPGIVDTGTLPVELVSFSVVRDGETAVLRWETASETNNAGFEIYHRTGSRQFEKIGWVNGSGTTAAAQMYTFRSGTLLPGRHAFRIKQIDFDGQFAWGPEVQHNRDLDRPYLIQEPYPNPYNPTTTLAFSVQQDQHVRVELYDMLGRQIATPFDNQVAANTMHHVSISGESMASGRYLVRVVGATFTESYQVYLVK